MKICTITCSNADNHGARLQTLALAEFLRGEGHDVEVIDYRPEYMDCRVKMLYMPRSVKDLAKLIVQAPLRRLFIRRHRAFDRFSERYIPLTHKTYYDYSQLRTDPPRADAYIAGSDQIWNTYAATGRDRAFYLDFGAPETLRISYAASFSHTDIDPDRREEVQRLISGIDAVSVRETSGLDILKDLHINGVRVVDPVFLLPYSYLTGDDRNSPFNKADSYNDPYLLVYDFERSPQVKLAAERIAKLRGLKIYSVSPWKLGYADRNFNVCDTCEFVALHRHAACVLGNSFHSVVLSMVFCKDFYAVDRADGLNCRMKDIAECYGLADRLISADAPDRILTSNIDYTAVHPRLNADIEYSRQWLRDSLNQKPSPLVDNT